MSPTKREREYARRRYEKWQARQAAAAQHRRVVRRRGLAAAGAVVAVLAVVGAVMVLGPDRTPTAQTAATTPNATSTGAASAAADNPCPAPAGATPDPSSWSTPPAPSLAEGKRWTLVLDTTCGPVTLQLDGAKAPKAVASMLFLARNGFWADSPCHRLTTAGIFVLQCGDPTATGGGGPGYSYGPVENAPADNVYPAGTVAIARQGGRADSMGSQFFIVYKDSTIPSDSAGGYSVVGSVVGGLATVEKVAAGGIAGGGTDGAPARAVSIISATAG